MGLLVAIIGISALYVDRNRGSLSGGESYEYSAPPARPADPPPQIIDPRAAFGNHAASRAAGGKHAASHAISGSSPSDH